VPIEGTDQVVKEEDNREEKGLGAHETQRV